MGLSGTVWFLDCVLLLVLSTSQKQDGYYQTALALLVILLASWAFVFWSNMNMDRPIVRLMMPMQSGWTIEEALFVWIMWAVMMGAMMLPSAAPMIFVHKKVSLSRGSKWNNLFFIGAYLLIWAGFSVVASILQWWLQWLGHLSHMLVVKNDVIVSSLLILVGISQWTRLKDICLGKCRTPIGFLTTEWREGSWGSFVLGLRHGLFCVGCCWALMALLFAFGVMNLTAIAALTFLVAAEKLLPKGQILARFGGLGLVGWGILRLAT